MSDLHPIAAEERTSREVRNVAQHRPTNGFDQCPPIREDQNKLADEAAIVTAATWLRNVSFDSGPHFKVPGSCRIEDTPQEDLDEKFAYIQRVY
jgi:hypothetical protein